MSWIDVARASGSLLVVLGLIALFAYGLRRWGDRLPGMPVLGRTATARRLAVLETLTLDARHRLVLVRCDEQEHAILISPNGTQLLPPRPEPKP